MYLQEIDRVDSITKEDFLNKYVKPQKPVMVKKFTENWNAYRKWNLNYIREVAGHKMVPLYDDRPVSFDEGFNEPHARMKMADYLDILENKPTNYRIFLYNMMKEVPQLQQDFQFPELGLRLLKQLPMLFFGGTNSEVFMHYDIDLANILHFQFHGEKQCIIFPPSQTKYLYKVPHSLISREDIDFDTPDYERFPALKQAKGYITHLSHGDMLYMPEGFWHYMKYLSPGFSMSLRALPRNFKNLSSAAYNVFVMRYYDNFMRKLKGQNWIDQKNKRAITNTHKELGITQ